MNFGRMSLIITLSILLFIFAGANHMINFVPLYVEQMSFVAGCLLLLTSIFMRRMNEERKRFLDAVQKLEEVIEQQHYIIESLRSELDTKFDVAAQEFKHSVEDIERVLKTIDSVKFQVNNNNNPAEDDDDE